MKTKSILTRLTLAASLALTVQGVSAQDIHFTQFDMAPLVLNPAFTGMFDGQARAAGIYRRQWASVTVPYVTFGASADMPIFTENNGDYLAGGLQLFNDKAGDGNLQNFTGLLSVAYHKFFGSYGNSGTTDRLGSDLAVGLQAGYAQKSIDLSKLYFGDELYGSQFQRGTSTEYANGIGNSVNYYLVNAGLCFSSAPSSKFSYTIGFAGNNLNQPNDAIEKKQNSITNLDMRLTGVLGINWMAGERLSIRPGVLYQTQAGATEIIGGSELNFQVSSNPGYENFSTAVFLGGWYRTGDAMMFTGGLEFKGFRIGLGYDYNISTLNTSSGGNGGFEIALRYIAPYALKFAGKRTVPCNRF